MSEFFNFPIKTMSNTDMILAKHGMCNKCGSETKNVIGSDVSDDGAYIIIAEGCVNCGTIFILQNYGG